MSQNPQRRPARKRTSRPTAPATRPPAPEEAPAVEPATEPFYTPEVAMAGDEHGWIAIAMMVFGIAIIGFLAILIAIAAG